MHAFRGVVGKLASRDACGGECVGRCNVLKETGVARGEGHLHQGASKLCEVVEASACAHLAIEAVTA